MKNYLQKFVSRTASRNDGDDAYRALVTRVTDDPPVRTALLSAPRTWFIPSSSHESAMDAPIAIPGGQTNSQPTTVAIMLTELAVRPGDRILDVGCGSGWSTALLAVLTGRRGKVYGIERHAATYAFGKENIDRFCGQTGFTHIDLLKGDGSRGRPECAPFDRILVSAGARRVPPPLKDQMRAGGRMVIPVDEPDGSQTLLVIQKQNDGSFVERRIPGFRFVPLVTE